MKPPEPGPRTTPKWKTVRIRSDADTRSQTLTSQRPPSATGPRTTPPKAQYRIPTNEEQLVLLDKTLKRHLELMRRVTLNPRRLAPAHAGFLYRVGRRHREADAYRLHELNPWAGNRWAECLLEAVAAHGGDDPVFMVTIINKAWELPPELRVRGGWSRARQSATDKRFASLEHAADGFVRSRLRGFDFVLQKELAVHRSRGPRPDVHVSLHYHGLVWGDGARLEEVLERFPDGLFGAPGGKARSVYDLAGALGYTAKDDRMMGIVAPATKWIRGRYADRHGNHHFEERIPGRIRVQLMRLLYRRTKPDLCIASGRGKRILVHAVATARTGGYAGSLRRST